MHLLIAILVSVGLTVSSAALDQVPTASKKRPVIRMTATEWPPYTSRSLENDGFMTHLAVQTFEKAGYHLIVDFSPWQRSLATAFDSRRHVGTIAVYRNPEREASCHLSEAIGKSTLGFVQRKGAPIHWQKLLDLTGVRIGAVSGYSNLPEFDRMTEDQTLDVSTVSSDLLNLRRLAFGRIDMAVIDQFNMAYLLDTDNKLQAYKDTLEFNPRPLATIDIHMCFILTEEGERLRDAFNAVFDPAVARRMAEEAFARLTP